MAACFLLTQDVRASVKAEPLSAVSQLSQPVTSSLLQEVLLWSDHRAGPTHPDPAYGLGGSEAVMLHQVTANQSPRPAQTS